jgi:transcriptional regulator with XRE-family HTH domain
MTSKEFRAFRLRLGLTQLQLAERMGVRSNTVWRWEHGALPRIAGLAIKGVLAEERARRKPRG